MRYKTEAYKLIEDFCYIRKGTIIIPSAFDDYFVSSVFNSWPNNEYLYGTSPRIDYVFMKSHPELFEKIILTEEV